MIKISDIQTAANTIKNETTKGANTANRIGTLLSNINSYLEKETKKYFSIGSFDKIESDVIETTVTGSTALSTIYAIYDDLVLNYPDYVSKETLGQDSAGNNIYCYTFRKQNLQMTNSDWSLADYNSEIDNPLILLNAGTHGFEKSAPFSLAYAMKYICEATTDKNLLYLQNNAWFKVIPCLNPWGYENNNINNYNGVNINTDFIAKTQIETNIACNFVDNNNQAIGAIDCHNTGTGVSQKSSGFNTNGLGFVIDENLTDFMQIALPITYSLQSNWISTGSLNIINAPFLSVTYSRDNTFKNYNYSKGIKCVSIEICRSILGGYTNYDDWCIKAGTDLILNLIGVYIKNKS